MSIGFKACADLFISDGSGFLYLYACCNLNLLEIRDTAWNTVDGEIWISRDSLPEPEVHEKIRRLPSGRKKLIVKRIPRWPLVTELIAEGKITVRNASGTWQTRDSVDMMAIRLINSILMDYQVKGTMPEHVSVDI